MNAFSWDHFRQKAAKSPCKIVLADGEDVRVIQAAAQAIEEKIAVPILVGSTAHIRSQWALISERPLPEILDRDALSTERLDELAGLLRSCAKYRHASLEDAHDKMRDPLILGCLVLKAGGADGFIGGATRTTADTLRAVFAIIGPEHRDKTIFGLFLIQKSAASRAAAPLVFLADAAVNPTPNAKQLAAIGVGCAEAFHFFTGEAPRTAFLSFSTSASADHPSVNTIREAVQTARSLKPEWLMEGEWQADAALDHFSAEIKGVGTSAMAGLANVLVVPDLNTGNIAYKLLQRLGGCRTVGPVLWGTALPANDLSRGCSSEDVLDMMALTSLQALEHKKKAQVLR